MDALCLKEEQALALTFIVTVSTVHKRRKEDCNIRSLLYAQHFTLKKQDSRLSVWSGDIVCLPFESYQTFLGIFIQHYSTFSIYLLSGR